MPASRGRFLVMLPLTRQVAAAECGLVCLAMLATYHRHRTDIAELRRRFLASSRGADVETMA